jgi:hypothetical protein
MLTPLTLTIFMVGKNFTLKKCAKHTNVITAWISVFCVITTFTDPKEPMQVAGKNRLLRYAAK